MNTASSVIRSQSIFRLKILNQWSLFWLISLPITSLVLWEMQSVDLTTGAGVSHMIGFAVRFAIPIIFIIVATSALATLFPNPLTQWLMRNRKFVGLSFAVAMFWQGVFIVVISTIHREYYFSEIYLFRDELEGTIGYIFMAAMVVTSFYLARKKITQSQWDLIHKGGMFFLWAYPFSTYWWSTTYGPEYYSLHYYIFYWMGLLAMLSRIAAWHKKRAQKFRASESPSVVVKSVATGLILIGLAAAATPMYWQEITTNFLTSPGWSAELVLWLPFWPMEPFLPLFLIWFATSLLTKPQEQ